MNNNKILSILYAHKGENLTYKLIESILGEIKQEICNQRIFDIWLLHFKPKKDFENMFYFCKGYLGDEYAKEMIEKAIENLKSIFHQYHND